MSYSRCAVLLVLVAAQSCSMPAAPGFTVAGEKANALLCRPEGNGPFSAIVYSHGRVTDTATLERARTGGWGRICQTLASDGLCVSNRPSVLSQGLRCR